MKKLLILFIVVVNQSISQTEFLPHINAEWHYQFGKAFDFTLYNESVKYVRDTMIGSESGKVVKHTRLRKECNTIGNYLTVFRKVNDSVFFRNSLTNQNWQMLINYNATSGQTWTFTVQNNDNSPQTFSVTVNSTGTKTVNGIGHKYLKVTYNLYNPFISNSMSYNDTIFERYASPVFLFNFFDKAAPACDFDASKGLLCYSDSTFGLKQFTAYSCNYTNVGLNENFRENSSIKAWPNPASDKLFVKDESGLQMSLNVEISDYLGRSLITQAEASEIDLRLLPPGIYFVRISGEKNILRNFILAKE
jgi:hypothetical protein